MKKKIVVLLCLLTINLVGCNSSSKTGTVDNKTNSEMQSVDSKVKLYEGTYFDDSRFGENTLKEYCEIKVSNIIKNSFDFTIYNVKVSENGIEDRKVIYTTKTAQFTDDGMKAVFNGDNESLKFSFPNNHEAAPIVTDIEVSGLSTLEGKTYVNNAIPGHEFG